MEKEEKRYVVDNYRYAEYDGPLAKEIRKLCVLTRVYEELNCWKNQTARDYCKFVVDNYSLPTVICSNKAEFNLGKAYATAYITDDVVFNPDVNGQPEIITLVVNKKLTTEQISRLNSLPYSMWYDILTNRLTVRATSIEQAIQLVEKSDLDEFVYEEDYTIPDYIFDN